MSQRHLNSEQIGALLNDAYALRISDLNKSISLAAKALAESRALKDKALTAKSLSHLSLFYMIQGEHDKSLGMAEEALPLYTALQDEKGLADVKYNMAGVYYKTDNFQLGLSYLLDCLRVYKKYNDYINMARTLKSMGTIYEYIGDEKNSTQSYEQSIDAAKKAGDISLESNVYNPLSGIYLKKGDLEKALNIIQQAVDIKRAAGDTRGLAFALYGRGKVYTVTGQYEQAEDDFNEALKIHMAAGDKLGTAMAYRKMGVLYERMGNYAKAEAIFRKAFNYSIEHNIAIIRIKTAYHLYKLMKLEKKTAKALSYLEDYIAQRESVLNTQTLKLIENYEMLSRLERMENEEKMRQTKAEMMARKNMAEQSARVRQEFLSTMSHEIRTPLNAVTTISSLLKDRTEGEDKELLESLRFASANLLQIINDILDFTKLDAGKASLELRPASLGRLMTNIYNTYKSMADEKGLQFILNIDKHIAEAYELDETKLTQILGNLVSNAVKYTEKGSIHITVTRTASARGTETVKFSVKDTGVGLSEANQKRVFEEFFQPHSITTKKEKGTGLGLAIVKKLVTLHNSHIHLVSKLGAGSDFYFELVLKKAVAVKTDTARDHSKLNGKKVLLAEDNPVNAMVATRLLHSWGMETEHAVNGAKAIEMAGQKKYDFILMDLHMPEMNGYDAARGIRAANNLNQDTLIYALTADITADQEEETQYLFNGFLRKPIEIEHMYNTLAENT